MLTVGQHVRLILERARQGRVADDLIAQLPVAVQASTRDSAARVAALGLRNSTEARGEVERVLDGFDGFAASVGVDPSTLVAEGESLAQIGRRMFE